MVLSGIAMSVGAFLFEKAGEWLVDGFREAVTPDEIDVKFAQALSEATRKIQVKYPDAAGGSLDFFFKDKQIMEEFLKLLFRKSKINNEIIERNFDIQTLPVNFFSEFIGLLKEELLQDRLFDTIFSNNEIYVSIAGIDANVEAIAQNTELTLAELKKIGETLRTKIADNFSYPEFYDKYRSIAINSFNEISFVGLGLTPDVRRGPKKLQDIYVKPRFVLREKALEDRLDELLEIEKETIAFKHIFNTTDRHIVILGDPGAGKSVLTKYIICALLEGAAEELDGDGLFGRLPVRVELRKYLAYMKSNANRSSLTGYIAHILDKEFNVTQFSEVQLVHILETKPTLLFFDGLDEIFNEEDKYAVKKDIENFLIAYGLARGIVTSRFIGYDEVKLDPELFVELVMQEFDDNQITEYVTKWYSCEAVRENLAAKEIEAFLEMKEDIDEELISNPLLLSLVVILYRNNGRLPHSKLEIYRSCTRTLVEKWDEVKKLEIDIKVKNKKESLFANLAFWQYEMLSKTERDAKNKNHITYTLVRDEVAKVILNRLKLTEDTFEAGKWADEFLEYAKNRSLYFENNFTHKTFLEYYTAFWIYQNSDLKGNFAQRNEIIARYIGNPFWHIVIELLINLIDENQPDTDIIDDIITDHTAKNHEAKLFFLEILHKLKNVNDAVVERMIRECVELCVFKHCEHSMRLRLFGQLSGLRDNEKFCSAVMRSLQRIAADNGSDDDVYFRVLEFQEEYRMFARIAVEAPLAVEEQYLARSPFLYGARKRSELDTREGILRFFELFGIERAQKTLGGQYRRRMMAPPLHGYVTRLLKTGDVDEIVGELKEMIGLGVDVRFLIDTIKRFSTNYELVNDEQKPAGLEEKMTLIAAGIV